MRLSELEALCQDGSDPEIMVVDDDGAYPVESRVFPIVRDGKIYIAASTLHPPVPFEVEEE